MAYGINDDSGFVAAPTDVHGAGAIEWASVAGIPATHPLVGGPDYGSDHSGMQADSGFARIITLPAGDQAPRTAAGAANTVGSLHSDWRDVFDFRGSPTPWVLVFVLAAVGFLHLSVNTRVGPARAAAGIG